MQTSIEIEKVLTPYAVNNLELLIDSGTGEVFTSQRGLAKLCGKARSTIQSWLRAENISNQKLKIRTHAGFRHAEAYSEETIAQALEKYNPKLLIQCQAAGLRIFLHGLVGIHYELKMEVKDAFLGGTTPKAYKAAKYIKEIENLLGETQPRLAQYLIDHCLNELLGKIPASLALPQPESIINDETPAPSGLVGVVEIAEEMGFTLDIGSRSQLGKFVKARLGYMAKSEKRLCNGKLALVNVYPNCELVRQVVEDFFKIYRAI